MSENDAASEIARLRAQVTAQEEELARLRRAAEGPTPTRRDILKSAGLVAGGIAAAAAVAGAGAAKPAAAVEGHNVRLRGLGSYLWLMGAKVGTIKGEVIQKGREGSIGVEYFQSKIVSPRDPASGLPSGKRQHQPLVIRKEIDRTTPLLLSALVTNETLEGEFKFFRPDPTKPGGETHYYTVKIENANVVSHNSYDPQANDGGTTGVVFPMEEVAFTYQKITWTNEVANVTAEDDWETPA